ncbi:MAG: pyridoxamine kinase [Oscillospiraceae bacterium]|jgi:pyridoxine kinase|nr:pyridoxamine kinase [Oscillospiraceae bacterium]
MPAQKQKRVLTIQDISCVGRCSLTVALPIISAAGIECSILPTAVLSTHTGGFEGYTYRDLTADISPITEHWKSLGLKFDAIYTGYLGSFEQIELVSKIFDEFKAPGGTILIDPVMGDNGSLYTGFTPEFALGMAKLCAKADVILPNLTEAAFMLGEPYRDEYSEEDIKALLLRLYGLGVKEAAITGVTYKSGKLGVAGFDGKKVKTYFNKRIDGYYHGTGDIYASAFLASYMKNGGKLFSAASKAAEFTVACIKAKQKTGGEARYGVPFELCLNKFTGSDDIIVIPTTM